MAIHPRFVKARKHICKNCPNQCDKYKNNLIEFENEYEHCPVPWIGAWPAMATNTFINESDISKFVNNTVEKGRAAWKDLHTQAINNTLTNESFLEWKKTIPTTGCSCSNEFKRYLIKNPFQPTFEWTVEAHNTVNTKLNKPILTVEEARAIWTNN